MRTFAGLYDCLRHSPGALMDFHAMELPEPLHLAGRRFDTLFVHDTAGPAPRPVTAEGFLGAAAALAALRRAHRIAEASARLVIWPDGRDDGGGRARHVVGGGWAVRGDGQATRTGGSVVFYAVRSVGDGGRLYLCADL